MSTPFTSLQRTRIRFKKPVFQRPVFTVNDRVAAQLAAMPRPRAEAVLRDAFAHTLNGTAWGRHVQGVYVIHWHSERSDTITCR